MVVKVKENFEKNRHVKILINLKNLFYVEEKMRDFMIGFYLN